MKRSESGAKFLSEKRLLFEVVLQPVTTTITYVHLGIIMMQLMSVAQGHPTLTHTQTNKGKHSIDPCREGAHKFVVTGHPLSPLGHSAVKLKYVWAAGGEMR